VNESIAVINPASSFCPGAGRAQVPNPGRRAPEDHLQPPARVDAPPSVETPPALDNSTMTITADASLPQEDR
jgi:hypothetical protein